MKNTELEPISPIDFQKKVKTHEFGSKVDLKEFFKPQINLANDFAVGPYYWFIPDNSGPRTVAASESFETLTPFSLLELVNHSSSPEFFANNIIEDDRKYVLSAISLAMKTTEEYHAQEKQPPKFNIYCRMLNKNWEFVWRLIQFPGFYFNEIGQAQGVFAMVTDLSHLSFINKPMMTVIDNTNHENQYFKVSVERKFLKPMNLPKITSREQEIIKLIVKGYNNPKISSELKITINTIQNHKRNLREKTNTKTSAELVAFIMSNNMV
jgi:DNA-binding NarL/FixJ family response regulator